MPSSRRSNRAALFVVLAVTLAGCADYMNRRDSVSLGIGNATEGNIAIQTINPQPPAAFTRNYGG
jgi:ABC-type uncharacterized transport system auxiliary subunit